MFKDRLEQAEEIISKFKYRTFEILVWIAERKKKWVEPKGLTGYIQSGDKYMFPGSSKKKKQKKWQKLSEELVVKNSPNLRKA